MATYFVNASHPAVSATGPEVINAGAASFGSVVQCNAIMLLVGGGGVVLLAVVVVGGGPALACMFSVVWRGGGGVAVLALAMAMALIRVG